MLKLKYLYHPLRTASAAKVLIAARLEMWRIAEEGRRRFATDTRYDLQSVTNGFASRADNLSDDTALLERICAAYIRAVERQEFAPSTYAATGWWQEVRQRSLRPVMRALLTRDIDALRVMYRNFFRDPCSTGLIGVPYGMSKAYFAKTIRDVHRRFYLSDLLYQIDHWMAETDGHFALFDLASPNIGNPFGVVIEGTLVEAGAPCRHYCAHRIASLLDSETATVAEIGGGFGGMAYYLLRDRLGVTYLDFDIPESIALTSYYLMKAFPQLIFSLYGEEETTEQAIARSDAVLLPLFELTKMKTGSVDMTFSSHAMSDILPGALADYLDNIGRMTRKCFLWIGAERNGKSTPVPINRRYPCFQVADVRCSAWHSHKVSGVGEVECLYGIGDVDLTQVRRRFA